MNIGLIIIGDEILSGKRQDKHLQQAIHILNERGQGLYWCSILPDKPEQIVATLKQTMAGNDLVFSCGGIGGTPDDFTRQSAADAAARPLVRHPGAQADIEGKYGEAAYPNRIRLADLPQDCQLIPNPINRIPGFSIGHHHFLPGFPEMAGPMMEWVLDTRYSHLPTRDQEIERAYILPNGKEGDLLPIMEQLVERFATISFSSLPSYGNSELGPHVEIGLRGESTAVEGASNFLTQALAASGHPFFPKRRGAAR